MAAKPKTKEKITRQGRRILGIFKRIDRNKPHVKVGIQESEFKKGRKGDTTNGLVALVNEFGTRRAGKNKNVVIPQRSFIRSTAVEKRSDWLKLSDRLRLKVLTRNMSIKQALSLQGLRMKADIQAKIVSLDKPPNKESTIKSKTRLKQKGNPLIATSDLLKSIKHLVVKA